jgi:hypothetical protein
MDQPTLAEGLEQAFKGIAPLKAQAAALACLADLSSVAMAFRQNHPACNPKILDQPAPAFPLKLDNPVAIKKFEAVESACKKLATALNSLDSPSLELIGMVPGSLVFRGPWSDELRHWVNGKAGEFFPVQDYEEEVDFYPACECEEERLVPKGPVPDEAPMVQRLAHVGALMACLSRESRFWAGAAARDEAYSTARETLEAKAERILIRECGAVLLRHNQGLGHLKAIAEAIFVWGLGGEPGRKASESGRWQERGFQEIRKELLRWWKTAYWVDDGLLF